MSKIILKTYLRKRLREPSKSYLMTFFFCITFVLMTSAQNNVISGSVKSSDGQGLPGANVLQKGTANGTVTDFDGNYTITLIDGKEKALIFSFVGFRSKEEVIGATNNIDVVLTEDSESLEDIVIIGYTAVKKENILGAVSQVKSEEIVQTTPVSTFDAVQGRLAGVQILTNGGPGEGFDIKIRGTSTFSAGGTVPLYVVDGQQLENIDNIDPSNIASLEVLKDAASAAIYGSKAANGVVLITTKQGQEGKTRIEVKHASSLSYLNGGIPIANTKERLFFENLRRSRDQLENPLPAELDSLNLLYRNSFDLEDLITKTAYRNQVNIAISGGNDKSDFYWDTGFLNEEGIVVNSKYRRLTSLIKLNTRVNSKLKLGHKLYASYEDQSGTNENSVLVQLAERPAYFPIFEPDGSFTPEISSRQNPLAEAISRTLTNRNFRGQLFSYAEYSLLPELTITSRLGINGRYRKRNDFNPSIVQNPSNATPEGRERHNLSYDVQLENFANYKQSFGNHTIGAFAGTQYQRWFSEGLDVNSRFVSDFIQTFNNANSETTVAGSTSINSNHSLFSIFGGFNYDYEGKYLLSGTIRRDGSSRFGTDRQFGTFPSGSIGWRVSSENFMSGLKPIVNNLLFRASYGEVGNERIGDFDSKLLFRPGADYNGINGYAAFQLPNPDLGWENTISSNIGVDLSMFSNRFNINVDLWEKKTEDLLALVDIPEESGFSNIRKNIGNVVNKGIDFAVSGDIIKTDNFNWFSSFNITFLKNEVTKLNEGTPFASGNYFIEEGQPIGNIYGYTNLGVFPYDESNAFTNDPENRQQLTPIFENGTFLRYELNGQEYTDEVEQLKASGTVLQGGDVIWEDLNGDLDITVEDRKILGNGLPTAFGGYFNKFTYKNFSLSFLFDFSFGNDIYRRYDDLRNDINNSLETPSPDRIRNAWQNPGDIAIYPRLTLNAAQNGTNFKPNSLYVNDGDYIKFRNIRFDYALPQNLLERIGWIKALSFNISGNNLVTWTNYPGYNPELGTRGNPLQPGEDRLRYPSKTQIIVGTTLQF